MNPEQLAAAVAALRNLVRVVEASIPAASPGRRNVVTAAAQAIQAMNARNAQGAFLAAGRAATSATNWVRQTGTLSRRVIEEQWGQSITPEELAAMRRDVDEAARALRTSLDALVTSSARSGPARSAPSANATLPADGAKRAIAHLASRASTLAAPDSVMALIADLARRAETVPPEALRVDIETAWNAFRESRPDVMRERRAIIQGERRSRHSLALGDDPPALPAETRSVLNRTWGWFHSPADVDAGRIEVDQAWASLMREVANARRRRPFTESQQAVLRRVDDYRIAWARVSRQLGSSWWDRSWGSGANAVEEGAAKYAQSREDLRAAGIDVTGSARGDTTPGQQQSQARAQARETASDATSSFGNFFKDPKILIAIGVVAFFVLRRK